MGGALVIEALRSSRAHAFVADVTAPALTSDDAHHLGRVLRLRAGETVSVSDGQGRWRLCDWTGSALAPVGEVGTAARPEPAITIAFAPVKGDRPEWVVQKLTELGVDRIVPLATARAVVRWDDDKAARQHERLGMVAREAAMQSRQVWLPEIAPVTGFAAALGWAGAALAEPGGSPPGLEHPVVLIGPEGGWSEAERASGLPSVGLADGILRSETAALTAGVILTALRATLIEPSNSHKEEGSVHPAVEPHRVVF